MTYIKITTSLAANRSRRWDDSAKDPTAMFFKLVGKSLPFSVADFNSAFDAGCIADGRAGGLVIGRLHHEGHIPIISRGDYGYSLCANMCGGEFIVNHEATRQFMDELTRLNSDFGDIPGNDVYFQKHIPRIIDARASGTTKTVLIDGPQFIVNRYATKVHIERLSEINELVNPFTATDPMHGFKRK